MKNQITKFLLILLVAQTINLSVVEGVKITSEKLGTFIYSITSQPFLALSSPNNLSHQSYQSMKGFVGHSEKTAKQR